MKIHIAYIAFYIQLLFLFSCKKRELMTYEGKPLVYFSIASVDSVRVDFSVLPDEVRDTILRIPVARLGLQQEMAVPYKVQINNQTTTLVQHVDFELPGQSIFAPHRSTDTLAVKLNRMAKLKQGTHVLGLELEDTPELSNMLFEQDIFNSKARKMRIFLTDELIPTPGWFNTAIKFGAEYYLGRFTRKKLFLIAKLRNLSLKAIYENIDRSASFYGDYLESHLNKMRNAGTPVLEEDGTFMDSGAYYK